MCNGEFTARQLDVIATGPCWPFTLVKSVPELRYFLDTEFNGFGGALISLALLPEYGDQDFYVSLPLPAQIHPLVEQNVIPYLRLVPPAVAFQLIREPVPRHIVEYLPNYTSEAHPPNFHTLFRTSYAVSRLK